MIKSFIVGLALTTSAVAQDYVLSQAENEHFRDYTQTEFAARLGDNASILSQYQCNGINEFNPFWEAVRQNPEANSLRVQLYQDTKQLYYREGKFYELDGRRARNLSNIFVAYVVDALEEIEKVPEGQLLLRQLERSHFPLSIVFGGNMFNPREEGGASFRGIYMANALSIMNHGRMTSENIPFHNVGVGGEIRWNPRTQGLPPHVALAHEMFHALDAIRGILDMRFVVGANYENAFVSEYRAVYMENIMRKAAGVEYRTHYGQTTTGPGVLDEHGEPRLMPSPCLTGTPH